MKTKFTLIVFLMLMLSCSRDDDHTHPHEPDPVLHYKLKISSSCNPNASTFFIHIEKEQWERDRTTRYYLGNSCYAYLTLDLDGNYHQFVLKEVIYPCPDPH